MKTLDLFVVHIPKRMKETVKVGGVEIYIDSRFDEFEHRINEGEVLAAPSKYDTGVKEGDTLYFHHIVVVNDGQPLTGMEDTYVVRYDSKSAINNQAIAYKGKDNSIHTLFGWCLTEPVEEEEKPESELIEVVKLNKKPRTKARIKYLPKGYDGEVKVGDVVGFIPNRDYELTIDDEKLFRTRIEDLLYVEG